MAVDILSSIPLRKIIVPDIVLIELWFISRIEKAVISLLSHSCDQSLKFNSKQLNTISPFFGISRDVKCLWEAQAYSPLLQMCTLCENSSMCYWYIWGDKLVQI